MRYAYCLLIIVITFDCFGQTNSTQSETLKDTLIETIGLSEITVIAPKDQLSEEKKRQIQLLIRRVYKVYPYAKVTADKLTQLKADLEKLKTKKDKKNYLKLVEKYIKEEYEDRLKHFSRKEGQVLVKLMYRQTGTTTYDLLDTYKSGWTAFWYKKIGKLYDIDIMLDYNPKDIQEDYIIEQILARGFRSGAIEYQSPHQPINLEELEKHWINKTQ